MTQWTDLTLDLGKPPGKTGVPGTPLLTWPPLELRCTPLAPPTPHAPWLPLHLKLPQDRFYQQNSVLPAGPSPCPHPPSPPFKSYPLLTQSSPPAVEPLPHPALLAGSLPCTLALSSAQNTPDKSPGHTSRPACGPSSCLTTGLLPAVLASTLGPLHSCPVRMIPVSLPQGS